MQGIKKLLRKLLRKKKITDTNIQFIGSQRPQFTIGKHSYVNGLKVYCWDNTVELSIGKYCSFAENIQIIAGGEHDQTWVSTYPFIDRWKLTAFKDLKKPRFKGNITIGHDVWIANSVTILSGVNIGHGAIVGACAIVTKDVPPYAVVAGNPAKIIKYRFEQNIIDDLLLLKWWDWNEEKIISSQKLFTSPIDFIKENKHEHIDNHDR